jgi:regulator of cell morphogenesis and NO signaling
MTTGEDPEDASRAAPRVAHALLRIRPVSQADERARWEQAPLDELIDHIVDTYHRPLPGALACAAAAVRAALDAQTARDRANLARTAATLERITELLLEHQRQEEELVFPWLRSRDRATAGLPVSLLEREHHEIERQIAELGALAASIDHDAERRPFATALGALAQALHEHIELENRVLFPRALAAARGA